MSKIKASVVSSDPFIEKGSKEDGGDDPNIAKLSEIKLERGRRLNYLKKKPRKWDKSNACKFHYRYSIYDIGLAVSVTDEIINLEPLEDKVNILRKKYAMTIPEVLLTIKNRLNFFSVYNLFDTV